MINLLLLLIIPILNILIHELGHYLVAKKLGYNAKIKIYPNICISLEEEPEHTHDVLISIAGTLFQMLFALLLKAIFIESFLININLLLNFILLLNLLPITKDGKRIWREK